MSWLGTLQGWTRRKTKFVAGTSAGFQTNYQLKITIHKGSGLDGPTDAFLGGNCLDNFGDIRFTDSDGTTLINYWIESISGTGDAAIANIWINIPNIPASPAGKNIYIYYNNPVATTTSNGANTFFLYDDFNYTNSNADTALWTPRYEYGSSAGSANIGVTEAGKLRVYQGWPGGSTWYSVQGDGTQLPSSFSAEIDWNLVGSLGSSGISFEVRDTTRLTGGTGFVEIARAHAAGGESIITGNQIWSRLDNSNIYAISTSVTSGKFRLRKLGSTIYCDYNIGAGWVNLSSYSIPYNTYIGVTAKSWGGSTADGRWDDLLIRRYASPEPSFGSSGNEELNITATDMALGTYSCLGTCTVNAFVTWYNYGNSNIINFTPTILIDGTTQAYGAQITIPSLGSASSGAITTPTLLTGNHSICPVPN